MIFLVNAIDPMKTAEMDRTIKGFTPLLVVGFHTPSIHLYSRITVSHDTALFTCCSPQVALPV